MAANLSIGRISSISLLVLLAVAAGTAQYLSRSEPATVPASQIATRHDPEPMPGVRATPDPVVPAPVLKAAGAGATGATPGVRAAATAAGFEPAAPQPATPEPLVTEPAASEPTPPRGRAEIAPWEAALPAARRPPDPAEPGATLAPRPAAGGILPDRGGPGTLAEARPAPRLAVATVPLPPDPAPEADTLRTEPATSSPAEAREDETGSVAAPAAARLGRVTVARLGVVRQGSPAPRDLAVSASRPKNMAPIPTRAPRVAAAGSIAVRDAATLFKNGAEIRIKQDANLYITARNIPDDDRLLAAYNADRPNGGRVQTRFGEATAVPGLLGIANQAHRAQDPDGRNAQAYSLADAMRDAIWRKTTAARLKSLTTAQNACTEGAGDTAKKGVPWIGLAAVC